MKVRTAASLIAGAALGVLLGALPATAQEKTVTIGAILPITGFLSALGPARG